jgi:hypothetical protein
VQLRMISREDFTIEQGLYEDRGAKKKVVGIEGGHRFGDELGLLRY